MNHTIPFTWVLETIPTDRTMSNLYMPLIYSGIEDAIMEFPEGYAEAFNRKIAQAKELFGDTVPFNDFDGFRAWVSGQIKKVTGGASTLEATKGLVDDYPQPDGPNHFSVKNQEAILSVQQRNQDELTGAMSYLVGSLNEMHGEFNNQQIKLLGVAAPVAPAAPAAPAPARPLYPGSIFRGNKKVTMGGRRGRNTVKRRKNKKSKKSKRRRN